MRDNHSRCATLGAAKIFGSIFKIAGIVAASLLALFGAAGLVAWAGARASLPALDGEARWPQLDGRVDINRDADGVPILIAQTRADLARALGFVHAQDRFFQMDLLRRAAAGELSALLGEGLLDVDKKLRVHRFRAAADFALEKLDPNRRRVVQAYADGVNQGLASLRARPPEYLLLRSKPVQWTAADSLLCAYAMFLQLQDPSGHYILQRGLLRAALPRALWQFLEAGAPEWDSAVDGSRSAEPQLPGIEVDLRHGQELDVAPPEQLLRELTTTGSNNWAVAGSRTATGAAIVANDMHLGFRVPNIWYRAEMRLAPALDITGVTLPGSPVTITGSNGFIAWGFTNSYGDYENLIRLVPVAGHENEYLTKEGAKPLDYVDESIEVLGGPAVRLHIAESRWGPVVGHDWQGRPMVLDWAAHHAEATNLDLLDMEGVHSATEALALAPAVGIPGQNFVVADTQGHIGWTIAGRLPARPREDAGVPQNSDEETVGIDAWQSPAHYPRVLDPPSGLLWSANARVVGGEGARAIGDGGYDRGARAAQIHADLVSAGTAFEPRDSLRVQLDDRALFLERWRTLLSDLLASDGAKSLAAAAPVREVLSHWSGHAAPSDAAYRLVHAFRMQVEARVYFMLIAAARKLAPDFEFEVPASFEGPLWRVVQARPPNLLAARYADWNALLLEALTASTALPPQCSTLGACDWGTVNAVKISHPLSRAVPLLSKWLDMPIVVIAGAHADMPRVQGRDFGASERFSVAPGHENQGYFHMPGGQSGHPLSPFYRRGFDAWAQGTPQSFLPGAVAHRFALTPK